LYDGGGGGGPAKLPLGGAVKLAFGELMRGTKGIAALLSFVAGSSGRAVPSRCIGGSLDGSGDFMSPAGSACSFGSATFSFLGFIAADGFASGSSG
jgi:hypothetical protein